MNNECPLKGQGLKKCYECQEFTAHKAFQCPQRLARQGGAGRGRGRGITGKRWFNLNNKSNFQYRSNNKRQFKNKENTNFKHSNSFKISNNKNKQFVKNNNDSQNKKHLANKTDSSQNQQRQSCTGTSNELKINFAEKIFFH